MCRLVFILEDSMCVCACACVCMCVCVCARARVRTHVCACVRGRVCQWLCVREIRSHVSDRSVALCVLICLLQPESPPGTR